VYLSIAIHLKKLLPKEHHPMSLRHSLAGVAGAVFVSVLLISSHPISNASYTATATGAVTITFEVPATQDPLPEPQPEQPFDWNWKYNAPTCDGVTVVFPSNLPASQQGVMEVNVVGGTVSGMQYKLEGNAYQVKYPNGHAGQTVVIAWSDFRNLMIPATGTWTVTQLQVHGTNFHWQGNLTCGSEPVARDIAPPVVATFPNVQPKPGVTLQPKPKPEVAPEPEATPDPQPEPEVVPEPEPTPEPDSTPEPEPAPAPVPDAVQEPVSEPVAPPATSPTPEALPAPVPEEPKPEGVVEKPAETPVTSAEEPVPVPAAMPDDEEGIEE
jgi:hypothetical protein